MLIDGNHKAYPALLNLKVMSLTLGRTILQKHRELITATDNYDLVKKDTIRLQNESLLRLKHKACMKPSSYKQVVSRNTTVQCIFVKPYRQIICTRLFAAVGEKRQQMNKISTVSPLVHNDHSCFISTCDLTFCLYSPVLYVIV